MFDLSWKSRRPRVHYRHVVPSRSSVKHANSAVSVPKTLQDYQNDPKWRELSNWGKELGVSSWRSDVVVMDAIHPNILMGSRLSVQELIDGNTIKDQHGGVYDFRRMHFLCAASARTCEYCSVTSQGTAFHLRDRNENDSKFLHDTIQAARHLRNSIKKKHFVLVHCHSGRNRSALVILVYCAMFTGLSYDDSVRLIKDNNATRFPRSSTLKNSSFTRIVKVNWEDLRRCKPLRHRHTVYGDY